MPQCRALITAANPIILNRRRNACTSFKCVANCRQRSLSLNCSIPYKDQISRVWAIGAAIIGISAYNIPRWFIAMWNSSNISKGAASFYSGNGRRDSTWSAGVYRKGYKSQSPCHWFPQWYGKPWCFLNALGTAHTEQRVTSLKAQLDNLLLHQEAKPNKLATVDEAFCYQFLVETILKRATQVLSHIPINRFGIKLVFKRL